LCNDLIIDHHLHESFQADNTLGVHATLGLEELAEEGISNSLDTAALELAIFITDQIYKLYTILLLTALEVGLG